MNNKTLFLILGALIGIFALTKIFSGNKDRSFDPNFLQIDTTAVNRIDVDLLEGEDYYLEKKGGVWRGVKNNLEVAMQPAAVSGILQQMAEMKILRITTKDKNKWPNFEIDEAKAKANITFKNGSKTLRTLVVGGFRFNQQARTAQSFVRILEGDEVYALDGFTSMSLGQTFDSYRDKTVLKVDAATISGIDIKTPSSNFRFEKTIAGWTDSEGTVLDSTKVVNYLQALSNFRATAFNDNYSRPSDFQNTISIQTTTQPTPYQIHINSVQGTTNPFAFESTYRPNVTFAGDSTNLFNALIKGKADFLK